VTSIESLTLGAGASTIGARAQAAGVTAINISAGASTLSATAFTVGLTVTMGANADIVNTGTGNDIFTGGNGVFVGDTISAGTGTDVIRITGDSSTATLDFDNLTGIEQVVVAGTTGGDTVSISLADITGASTTQTIVIDAAALTGASDTLTVASAVADTGGNTSFSITGAAGNDVLAGGLRADTINGGAGNDSLAGNAGNDVLDGGAGSDTIAGGDGNDSIVGGDANDILTGGNGNDTILAGAGNDAITGGVGADRMTGGTGADTFTVGTEASTLVYDTITDLTLADDDVISGLSTGGDGTAETFNATVITLGGVATFQDYLNAATATNGTEGEISWFQFNGNTYVVQDNNAAATYTAADDIVIEIVGLVDLSGATAGDGSLTV